MPPSSRPSSETSTPFHFESRTPLGRPTDVGPLAAEDGEMSPYDSLESEEYVSGVDEDSECEE
jgi:hypothetical protein